MPFGEEASGRLLTRGEEERRGPHDRGDLGRRPIGILGQREVGQDVSPRLATAVLDVRREVVVEPVEGVEPRPLLVTEPAGRRAEAEALAEPLVLRLRHAEQVGHDQHGERL